jgi:hypothetical protein
VLAEDELESSTGEASEQRRARLRASAAVPSAADVPNDDGGRATEAKAAAELAERSLRRRCVASHPPRFSGRTPRTEGGLALQTVLS